jgi:repressor LexA
MLTRKQHELLCFIHDRLAETGISPSFEEMKDALDLASKSGVHRLISALEERGFIKRLANRARALEVVKMPDRGGIVREVSSNNVINLAPTAKMKRAIPQAANDVLEIPLHGRIAAGLPIEALEGQSSLAVQLRCSVLVSILRSKCQAIRWLKRAFSTAIMR